MQERSNELSELGAEVLLIAYDEQSLLEAKMLKNLDVTFPILLDREKETYRSWGMGRASVFQAMLSPKLNVRYAKLLLKGEKFLGFAPDMFQLGGDFVVDGQGSIELAHVMRDNGDRASINELVEAIRSVK